MRSMLVVCCTVAALSCGCRGNGAGKPYDFERDAPVWLKAKVDSLATRPDYNAIAVFRYEWRGDTLYYISLPLSSCLYCELYDKDGRRYHVAHEDMQAFIDADKHEKAIWGPGK